MAVPMFAVVFMSNDPSGIAPAAGELGFLVLTLRTPLPVVLEFQDRVLVELRLRETRSDLRGRVARENEASAHRAAAFGWKCTPAQSLPQVWRIIPFNEVLDALWHVPTPFIVAVLDEEPDFPPRR